MANCLGIMRKFFWRVFEDIFGGLFKINFYKLINFINLT